MNPEDEAMMNSKCSIHFTSVDAICYMALAMCLPLGVAAQSPIAIKDPALLGYPLKAEVSVFSVKLEQLLPCRTLLADSSGGGLLLDLGDSTLSGRVYWGQAFFDMPTADYAETEFARQSEVRNGRARIELQAFFDPGNVVNANRWVDRGVVGYRLDLLQTRMARTVHAGVFDSHVYFQKRGNVFAPIVSITEGPSVALIESSHPEWIVISFETDLPSTGRIEVEGIGLFADPMVVRRHEIRVERLKANKAYTYRVLANAGADTASTPWLVFRSAPRKGQGDIVFAYAGDARQSTGGYDYAYQGINRRVMGRLTSQAFRQGASFLLFGGDMVGGYTNSASSMRQQLKAFKQTIMGFTHSRPLYTSVGNHESLLHSFDDKSARGIGMDKWPYDSASTESMIGKEFVLPLNAPEPYKGMPPYSETVYAFQYGNLYFIVLNSVYWWTSHNRIPELGGSPEGYILPNQLTWLEGQLRKADADPTVRHILVMSHEPPFPAGGHVKDAMWHGGDNRVRAYRRVAGDSIVAFPMGIVEVRNRMWEMVSATRKVAAVLSSDEHNYHRFLISSQTPVGDMTRDDLNRNGILDDGVLSPEPAFRTPTWFIISGGAGAPYYTDQPSPWQESVRCFTPQHHVVMFRSTARGLSLEVFGLNGQLLDRVDDLGAVRRTPQR
jgi:hypothetical protein